MEGSYWLDTALPSLSTDTHQSHSQFSSNNNSSIKVGKLNKIELCCLFVIRRRLLKRAAVLVLLNVCRRWIMVCKESPGLTGPGHHLWLQNPTQELLPASKTTVPLIYIIIQIYLIMIIYVIVNNTCIYYYILLYIILYIYVYMYLYYQKKMWARGKQFPLLVISVAAIKKSEWPCGLTCCIMTDVHNINRVQMTSW